MRPYLISKPQRHSQSGMTLIEVLVALVIFSVGIMGMISLQLLVLKRVEEQRNRNTVIWTAQELLGRIRSNNQDAAIIQYATDVSSLNAANNFAICNAQPAFLCADHFDGAKQNSAVCTPAQMATYDTWQTFCAPAGVIPGNVIINENDSLFDTVKGMSASLTCPNQAALGLPCSSVSDLVLRIQWSSASAASDPRLTGTIMDSLGNVIPATEDFYIMQFRP